MSTYLKTNLPQNIQENEVYLFSKRQYSIQTNPKIKTLKNVFVNQQGLVLKNGLLVKGCAFNLKGKEDTTVYFPFWRKVIEQYFVCKFGKSLKYIQLKDDNAYLLIHSAWFNYSFWVNSFLIRLISFLKTNSDPHVYLIYPEEWDKISYVKQSLDYFNIKKKIIPADHHIFVKNLILPETREWTSSFYVGNIRYVYDWFRPFVINYLIPPESKIYLSRKKRDVRCVANEEEILLVLQKYDFEVFEFDEMSYMEQVNLMMHTSHFISIHGAGFSNIVFMQAQKSVMELINQEYAKLEYTFPFWKLADALDLNYFYQFGDVSTNFSRDLIKEVYDIDKKYLVNENIHIDSILFEKNIRKMLYST